MKKSDMEPGENKLGSALPLNDYQDGFLIVVDRENWQIRVYYEGSAATLEESLIVLDLAKDMMVKKYGVGRGGLTEEEKEENLN